MAFCSEVKKVFLAKSGYRRAGNGAKGDNNDQCSHLTRSSDVQAAGEQSTRPLPVNAHIFMCEVKNQTVGCVELFMHRGHWKSGGESLAQHVHMHACHFELVGVGAGADIDYVTDVE